MWLTVFAKFHKTLGERLEKYCDPTDASVSHCTPECNSENAGIALYDWIS